MGMAAQQRVRQRSNGNGDGSSAMGVAVVVANSDGGAAMVEAAQQWWWTEAFVEYHRIVSYSVFGYQIDILRSFLHRPHTDRFPDDVLKKLRRNRNRDSCEKKHQRSGKNRNPKDSYRNYQPRRRPAWQRRRQLGGSAILAVAAVRLEMRWQHSGGSINSGALVAAAWHMLIIILILTMTMMTDY